MALYYAFPCNYVLLDKLQWPEPLGETHNIKLHRKATIPVFTPDLSFLQQSGLSITLKFLFHAQCIWLLSPKAWHECLQACPDGRPLSSSSFASESTDGHCPSLLLRYPQSSTQVTWGSWREPISSSHSWWVGQPTKAERQEKHIPAGDSWKKTVPVLASRG